MDLNTVKEFIQLAKSEGVAELKYEQKDLKIQVNFNAAPAVSTVQMPMHTAVPAASNTGTSAHADVDAGLHVITSPFVGTYYGQSAPGKPSFVKVGDKVGKGQTLCILEAMKIMNEIESDVAGEIVEICVDNESLVEFGQPLFKVRV